MASLIRASLFSTLWGSFQLLILVNEDRFTSYNLVWVESLSSGKHSSLFCLKEKSFMTSTTHVNLSKLFHHWQRGQISWSVYLWQTFLHYLILANETGLPLPGTNTLAYFASSSVTKKKFCNIYNRWDHWILDVLVSKLQDIFTYLSLTLCLNKQACSFKHAHLQPSLIFVGLVS